MNKTILNLSAALLAAAETAVDEVIDVPDGRLVWLITSCTERPIIEASLERAKNTVQYPFLLIRRYL